MVGAKEYKLIKEWVSALKELKLSPTEENTLLRMCNYKKFGVTLTDPSLGGKENPLIPYTKHGWLSHKDIEYTVTINNKTIQKPYSWNKRWNVLDNGLKGKGRKAKDLIDITSYIYINKRSEKKSYKIYKINDDMNTFLKLFFYFGNPKVNRMWEFVGSDYFKDSDYIAMTSYIWHSHMTKPSKAFLMDIQNLRESNKKRDMEKSEENIKQLRKDAARLKRSSKILPPSFVYWWLHNFDYTGWKDLDVVSNLTIQDIFASFLIQDILCCPDKEVKKELLILMNSIKQQGGLGFER